MTTVVNVLLLFLVFGGSRWKKFPYVGAVIFATIKGMLYAFEMAVATKFPLWAIFFWGTIGFIVFGTLSGSMVYFLRRLDRDQPQEVSYVTSGAERTVFKWEYFPITAIVLLLLFGEMWVGHILRSHR